jgi:hypothetical protein
LGQFSSWTGCNTVYILFSIPTVTQLYVVRITDGYNIVGDTDSEGVSA